MASTRTGHEHHWPFTTAFLDAVDEWNEDQNLRFVIAVGECGYSFDPQKNHPDDFEVDIYELDSLKELAEGLYGPIPASLAFYIDYDAIARDLACDFTETTLVGKRLIYACY